MKKVFFKIAVYAYRLKLGYKKQVKVQTLGLNGDYNTSWKTHFVFWEKKAKDCDTIFKCWEEGVHSICLLIKNKIHILTEVYVCSIFSNVLNGGLGVRLSDKSYPNQLPWEGACMCMHISVPLYEQYFQVFKWRLCAHQFLRWAIVCVCALACVHVSFCCHFLQMWRPLLYQRYSRTWLFNN